MNYLDKFEMSYERSKISNLKRIALDDLLSMLKEYKSLIQHKELILNEPMGRSVDRSGKSNKSPKNNYGIGLGEVVQ